MIFKQRKQIVTGILICVHVNYVSTRLSSLINLFLTLNPFNPKRIAKSYQLDHSISVLRVVVGIFRLYYFLIESTKQTVETLIRRRVPRSLILVCTVCLCPTKMAYNFCILMEFPIYMIYIIYIDTTSKHLNFDILLSLKYIFIGQ